MSQQAARILYCHCAYAKVVPAEVKAAVLSGLAEANAEFDAVPDLCEMAARGDERLRELAAAGPLQIAACYPRAVKWLFAAAGAQLLDDSVRVWNMRVETAETIVAGVLDQTGQAGRSTENEDALHGDAKVVSEAGPAGDPVATVPAGDTVNDITKRELAS
jgi:hypothetical protein